MKLIILAAGRGTRLKHLTEGLPKGMLEFNGKTLLEQQIETARRNGITDITIVKGFQGDKIQYGGIKYGENPLFASTNMVETLFCVEDKLNDDIIISYADIIYEDRLLQNLIKNDNDIVVSVDSDWKNYWKQRYGKVNFDLESLGLNGDQIVDIGKEDSLVEDIDARYIGLIKFSKTGVNILKKTYHANKSKYTGKIWPPYGREFELAYMTDILAQLIQDKHSVHADFNKGGWLEFDTVEDYEFSTKILDNPELYTNTFKL